MTNAEAKELLARKLRQIIDHWDGTTETKLLGDALSVAVSSIDRVTPKKVKPYEKICPCCGKGEPVPGWYVCGAGIESRREEARSEYHDSDTAGNQEEQPADMPERKR